MNFFITQQKNSPFQWEQCCWSPFFASASKSGVSLVVAVQDRSEVLVSSLGSVMGFVDFHDAKRLLTHGGRAKQHQHLLRRFPEVWKHGLVK